MILLLTLATASAAPLSVVGKLTREAALEPGATSRGAIVLRNNTDAPLTASISARDYRYRATGETFYDPPGAHPRSNAAWIDFAPAQLVIPAGAEASVSYVVSAPAEAVPSGTYWSALLVEPVTPREASPEGNVSIHTVFRYAVQMVTQIGRAEPALAVEASKLEVVDGRRFLAVDLRNDGDAWATPRVWADVYTAEGGDARRLEAAPARLYPGCSARARLDLTDLPAAAYSALVIADAGTDVVGAQYTLDLR